MRLGKKRASSRTVICNPRSFGYQRRKNRDSCPNGYHRLLTVKASAVFVHLSSFSSVSAHSAGDTERSASSTEYAENRIGSGNVCKVRHGHMQEIGFVDAMQANVGEVVSADPSASHRIASHRSSECGALTGAAAGAGVRRRGALAAGQAEDGVRVPVHQQAGEHVHRHQDQPRHHGRVPVAPRRQRPARRRHRAVGAGASLRARRSDAAAVPRDTPSHAARCALPAAALQAPHGALSWLGTWGPCAAHSCVAAALQRA